MLLLPRPHCCRRLPSLLVLVLSLAAGLLLAADNPREARVKAAYLFNLSLFTDWSSLPAEAFTLCVAGDSGIGTALRELESRLVKERPLRIEPDPLDPAACQLLYIGSGQAEWQGLLQQLAPGVLTVSDHAGFARDGGIVGFYTDAGKVKLEISQGAAERAGLRISARVLELARVLP